MGTIRSGEWVLEEIADSARWTRTVRRNVRYRVVTSTGAHRGSISVVLSLTFDRVLRRSGRRPELRKSGLFQEGRHMRCCWFAAIVVLTLVAGIVEMKRSEAQAPQASTAKSKAPRTRPPLPMYPTVILKPGDSQLVTFSAPAWAIGGRDRTQYHFETVNDTGEKAPGLRNVGAHSEWKTAVQLSDKYGSRLAAIRILAKEDAEIGKTLFRIRGEPFGAAAGLRSGGKGHRDQVGGTVFIDRIDLYRVAMPLISPWRTAYGEDAVIESVLVKMTGGDLVGWGEASPLAAPTYSPEWAAGVFMAARDWLAPRLVGQDVTGGRQLQERLAIVKGNYFAKGGLDLAWWDSHAKGQRQPLYRVLGGTNPSVTVGADFGVMDKVEDLMDKMGEAASSRIQAGKAEVSARLGPAHDPRCPPGIPKHGGPHRLQ